MPIDLRVAALAAALLAESVAAGEFWVAPDGADSFPGTKDQPFATPARALDATRKLPPDAEKRIVLRGGKYFAVSLELKPQDSGLSIEAAPGEKPVLYGGVVLKGWKKEGDRFYVAPLPDPWFRAGLDSKGAPKPPPWVQMLQADATWAPKARYPGTGNLEYMSEFTVPWMSTTAGGFKRKPTQAELTTLIYNPQGIPPSMHWANAQLEIFHIWDESNVGVGAHDPSSHLLTLSPAPAYPPGAFGVKKFVIWNTPEGMTSPGQWFHDRSRNCLVYWPPAGKDMNTAELIVPVTTSIIHLGGTPDAPIKNVRLKGLALSVTNTPMASSGFAAEGLDGAVALDHTESCVLENLDLERVGGHAINSRSPGIGTQVRNCEIGKCGAGGIYVGGTTAMIKNNHIHDVGLQYPAAVGIFRCGHNFMVAHNEIHNTPYSAISCGGNDNIIQDNLIHDCMKTLHDGAAIYLSGAKKCVVRGNLVHSLGEGSGRNASSFYLDEQCEDCVVEKNLSTNVSWPLQNNMARNNIVRNNVLTAQGDLRLGFTNCSGFILEKNVIDAGGKISIVNIQAVSAWSGNVFHSRAGSVDGIMMRGSKDTGTVKGLTGDTVGDDPLFRDPQAGDYGFRIGSPALRLGIEPVDVSRAGRTH